MKLTVKKWIFLLLLLFVGCAQKQVTICDILIFPQSNQQFSSDTDNNFVLAKDKQELFVKRYRKIFFSPWAPELFPAKVNLNEIFNEYFENPGFGSNKIEHEINWFEKIKDNSDFVNYPNVSRRAITIRNSNLRIIPTDEPRFKTIDDYPFDSFQNSAIQINVPLLVDHMTKDKVWVYVTTNHSSGWMHANDIAFVDDKIVREIKNMNLVSVLKDEVPIYDLAGNFVTKISIGTHLFADKDGKFFVFKADDNQKAKKLEVNPHDKSSVGVGFLEFNKQNAINIADQFLNQKYGWGGLFDHRDCSATTRDYFSAFGIWLPRNSAGQIKYKNHYTDLSKMTNIEKKDYILKNAVPYRTIIWMQGHIMLYVGSKCDEPLILHNIWGTRIKPFFGNEYTNIIGKTVITTLEPGKEIHKLKKSILTRIAGMRIITDETITEAEVA